MSDSNASPECAAPRCPDTNVVFGQAMTAVRARCGQLATLINARDYFGVEYTARDASNMWLAGRAACRRLLQRSAASPYTDAARRLLEENYMILLVLFERATRTINVPRMREALRALRGTLMAAMSHPLSGDRA